MSPISKILERRRGFAGSLHYFWYAYCRHGRLHFLIPETQRSGTGDSVSKYPMESAKRVLQRAFDQITILRQFLKSTRVCWYSTNSLQTVRAKASSSLPKNFLIFPCKTHFFFSSPLWLQLLTQSHATCMEQPLFWSNAAGTWTVSQGSQSLGLPVPDLQRSALLPAESLRGRFNTSQDLRIKCLL